MGTLGRTHGAARRQTLVPAAALLLLSSLAVGCSHTQTVRLQPNTVDAGTGSRPIAGIQTNAVSWYLLFVPIPGGVDLDRVVNRMLIVAAKTMGADKVAQLRFEATPNGGVWALRKLFLWRSASAHGIAVQVTESPPDPGAEDGPEPVPANDPPH
ncbi:MAG TPA: hypothetical protein VML75_05050 [Kofleriaceae bacterium]|nr:hypothetical protein [Kofleriaceae bacterium]